MTKESSTTKDDVRPAGRVVHDERGNAVWQPSESFESEDTLHVLLNTDELALLEGTALAGPYSMPGFDPYAKDPSLDATPAERKRPRTDLRALSAQIIAERERRRRTA